MKETANYLAPSLMVTSRSIRRNICLVISGTAEGMDEEESGANSESLIEGLGEW